MSPPTVDPRVARLLQRLVGAAESSLGAGDLETARATVAEVLAVDPGNIPAAELAHRIAEAQPEPAGERALMTLLFADLVGSTTLSEQVEPEQLRDLFAMYRGAARRAVQRYGGHVMKFMGDGILAGFGYPNAHEDDARRALHAALDLVAALQSESEGLARRLGAAPQVRVGIHTGGVVVADLADEPASDSGDAIVGAAPNLAARIQSVAQPDQVVISDVTRHLVETDFHLQSLGVQELKGIRRPVEVFAVQRPRHVGARLHAERYRRVPLIDPEGNLDQLLFAWDAVATPAPAPAIDTETEPGPQTGSTHLIVGEPGVGKTRLVAELVERIEEQGAGRVLAAACLPYYANVALWPLAQMAVRLVDAAAPDGDRGEILADQLAALGLDPARAMPFLGPLVGIEPSERYPAPQLDPAAALAETLNQSVQWLAALGSRTPTLLVVEDLHWADASTLALLGRIAERRPPGVLTVATTRPEPAVAWRESAVSITLSRLPEDAAGRLVDGLVGATGMDAEVRQSIVTRSEGIPLFVEELTQSRLDEGADDGMPVRLRELLTWRLKSPRVNLRVVQAAAALGPAFDADVLAAVIGDPQLVSAQLAVLTDEGIVEAVAAAGATHRFRHALLRDAAYETQLLDDRAGTHGQIAVVLSKSGAEPALIAEHLERSGDLQGAAGMYISAAQAQQAKGAHTEAAGLLTRALGLLADVGDSPDRDLAELTARMLRGLSVSALHGYAAPEVQGDHKRADDLARRLGGRPEVLPSLIAIWAYWFTSGDLGTSGGLIERLQQMVSRPDFAWFSPEVESCAGFQDFFTGSLESAHAHFSRSLAGFGERSESEAVSPFWPLPNDPIAVSAIGLACVCALQGELGAAQRWEAEALARAEAIGFPRGPWSAAFVKTYAAWVRRFTGDDAASRELGRQVVAIGMNHGYAYWQALGSSYLAGPGDDSPGSDFHEQVTTSLRAMGQHAFAAASLEHMARLRAAEGDVGAARELIDEALEVARKNGELLHLPQLLHRRAEYRLAQGDDPHEAARDLMAALEVATEQGARITRLRAAVALARLPAQVRPSDWAQRLTDAGADMPADLVSADTTAADELLA